MVADLNAGDGLLPRLMKDEALADELETELRGLLKELNEATEKLNRGEGTAAKLLNDPAVYDAISDILVGINESRMLRWLIRNRQKAGIRERYEDAQAAIRTPPRPRAHHRAMKISVIGTGYVGSGHRRLPRRLRHGGDRRRQGRGQDRRAALGPHPDLRARPREPGQEERARGQALVLDRHPRRHPAVGGGVHRGGNAAAARRLDRPHLHPRRWPPRSPRT